MADTTATGAEHADRPAQPRLSIDAKWIVTTGVAIALLLIALVSMMFQQNAMLMQQYATINARIDDTNANVSIAQIEIRELRNQMHTEIRELRTEMQTEMREMRAEMREMRDLLIQLLERTAPASPVD